MTVLIAIFWLLLKLATAPAVVAFTLWLTSDEGTWIPEDECYAGHEGNPGPAVFAAVAGAFIFWIWVGEITGLDIVLALILWVTLGVTYLYKLENK